MTMQDVLEKMKNDIRFRGLSESAYKNYARNVRLFLEFCGRPIEKLLGAVDREDPKVRGTGCTRLEAPWREICLK